MKNNAIIKRNEEKPRENNREVIKDTMIMPTSAVSDVKEK